MNFWAIGTEIEIVVLMLITLAMDLLLPREASRRNIGYVVLVGLAAILIYTFGQYHIGPSMTFFGGLFFVDNYALFFKQLFLVGMFFAILFSLEYAEKLLRYRGEFYALLLSALLGMCVMASANDFVTTFVGLELMTVSFYILVGARMTSADSSEAAVKYLIVGAGSTAVMLYGMSLVYGAAGSLVFSEVCRNVHLFYAAGLAGVVMVIIGFFFNL